LHLKKNTLYLYKEKEKRKCHDITEILLKVALRTITRTLKGKKNLKRNRHGNPNPKKKGKKLYKFVY